MMAENQGEATVGMSARERTGLESLLSRLILEERLAEFDRHWIELLARLDPAASPTLLLAAALARSAIDRGDVCVELERLAAGSLLPGGDGENFRFPPLPGLHAQLARSPLVTVLPPSRPPATSDCLAGDHPDCQAPTPLVLENHRLYLHRYWYYERELAAAIRRRLAVPPPVGDSLQRLPALSAAVAITPAPGQAAAIRAALEHRLAVISGGPGTGKTTIIFFILALAILEAMQAGAKPPRIMLLAPTGKAAARLADSLQARKRELAAGAQRAQGGITSGAEEIAALAAALPAAAMTIHRALGFQPERPTRFRRRADNPLAAELVVVDEASMVDVALMSKLFAAVPAGARLVLLGDKDQLASVEAGSILGDLCLPEAVALPNGGSPHGQTDGQDWPAVSGQREDKVAISPDRLALGRAVVTLEQGFRFDARRGIGALTAAIKAGDGPAALAVLRSEQAEKSAARPGTDELGDEEVRWGAADFPADEEFQRLLLAGFSPGLKAADPAEALVRLNDFRLLCAHRRGEAGVEGLNLFCRRLLAAAGLVAGEGEWYRGRPLLITANDYELNLYNGDLGVIWDSSEDHGELRAFFPAADGVRRLLPSRLPRHETAFAMTIHKSQGSEFERVAVVLPRQPSPILTRELLYTAVSRARRQVWLFADPEIITTTVSRRVERASGLAARLRNG